MGLPTRLFLAVIPGRAANPEPRRRLLSRPARPNAWAPDRPYGSSGVTAEDKAKHKEKARRITPPGPFQFQRLTGLK